MKPGERSFIEHVCENSRVSGQFSELREELLLTYNIVWGKVKPEFLIFHKLDRLGPEPG